jgi:hypothetical protein
MSGGERRMWGGTDVCDVAKSDENSDHVSVWVELQYPVTFKMRFFAFRGVAAASASL